MHAVDTNVVVRYVTRDDARQAARAAALIDGEAVFVATTVVLETEWILRALYRQTPGEIVAALRTLAGQPTVTFENPTLVGSALAWAEQGMDLADALHLASSQHCDAFVTFDRSLAKSAAKITTLPVRAL